MNVFNVCMLRLGREFRLVEKSARSRYGLSLIFCMAVFFGHMPVTLGSDSRYADYQLKAAFSLNFPNFITWPGESVDTKNVICTFGDHAVADSIGGLLASDQMTERKENITFFRDPNIDVHCDLAFVGVEAENHIAEIRSSTRGEQTLIVSDKPDYAVSGGMIELALVDTRIQVILNRKVMESLGFIVDSRLLQLTIDVSSSAPEGKK